MVYRRSCIKSSATFVGDTLQIHSETVAVNKPNHEAHHICHAGMAMVRPLLPFLFPNASCLR
jgi:hypothetical protein